MPTLSEARVSFLAHAIVRALRDEDLADIENERLVLAEIKRLLAHEDEAAARMDAVVRRKIASLSRTVVPGSREWDVLYRQYFEQELRKTRA